MQPAIWAFVACALCAYAQPPAVDFTSVTGQDGNAVVSFTTAGTATTGAAATFEVLLDPVNPYPLSAPVYYGATRGPFAMTSDSDAVGNVTDVSRWRPRHNMLCPYAPPAGQFGSRCRTFNGTIVTANRRTTLNAHAGHLLNLQGFFRALPGDSAANPIPGAQNGVPILEPLFTLGSFPLNERYTIETVITGFPIAFNWNRQSWSGLLVYDIDSRGRVRPLWKTALEEYWGQWQSYVASCSGTGAFAACSWNTVGSPQNVGGSVLNPAPSPATPWRYILDVNPVARTLTTRHVHPTTAPNGFTGHSFNLNTISASMGTYWTQYVNRTDCAATQGCLIWENLRVAPFVEVQSGITDTFSMEVERTFVFKNPILETLMFGGPTTGASSILLGSALDATRYTSVILPTATVTGNCPNAPSNAPSSGTGCRQASGAGASAAYAEAGPAQRSWAMTGHWGHQFDLTNFMNRIATLTGPARVTAIQDNPVQNGCPVLELIYNPANFSNAYEVNADVTAFTEIYDWNRFSWSGVMLYHKVPSGPFAGQIRPLMKTGLYEWLGSYYTYVPVCSAIGNPATSYSCFWSLSGSTFSVGGSVVTLPTVAIPWRYGIIRDPVGKTWQVEHVNPRGSFGPANGAPAFSDAGLQASMGAYWTDYINNPDFGAFSWDDVRVGAFVEVGQGSSQFTPNVHRFGMHVKSMYIENYRDQVLMQQWSAWSSFASTAGTSGSQCAYGAPSTRVFTRDATICVGSDPTTCTVRVPLPTQGLNHSVTVTSISATGVRGAPRTSSAIVNNGPSLPIPGAQLWLDAASMSTWLGNTAPGFNLACPAPTVGTCRPAPWWHSSDSNRFFFGGGPGGNRPMYKPWAPADPYPAVVFDGVDDIMTLDIFQRMAGRDAEFDMQFPDQTGYNAERDAETTWFLLYRPAEPTSNSFGTRTVFGKGNPQTTGGSAYSFYQQRVINSPAGQFSTYDQMLGMAVVGDTGTGFGAARGTVVGQRYARITFAQLAGSHPHTGGAMVTLSHYRNATGGLSNRAYRLDACDGVVTGNWATDRCSTSGGTSPADRWSSTTDPVATGSNPTQTMGIVGLLRQPGLPAAPTVPGGAQHADYAIGPTANLGAAPAAMPAATGVFAVGAATVASAGFANSFYRGQIMSVVMYRRAMNDTEKNQVQMFLLNRYNQLCPAIPQFPGALNGCPASSGGTPCLIQCNAVATPPTVRLAGQTDLVCVNGGWRGRVPVCGVSCPARSSPRDYEQCALRSTDADFFGSTDFPVNTVNAVTAAPGMRWLDAFPGTIVNSVPALLPAAVLNRAWTISNAPVTGRKMLIGEPLPPVGCNPESTGPLMLMENNPRYLDTQLPNGRQQVDISFRLLAPGSSAAVLVRARATGDAYRVVIGAQTQLERINTGFANVLSTVAAGSPLLPVWDFTGSSIYTLRVTVSRRNPAVPTDTAVSIVAQLSTTATFSAAGSVTLFSFQDFAFNNILVGVGGFAVMSGRVGIERFTALNDCEQAGNVCRPGEGQACTWQCSAGTIPMVGSVQYSPTTHGSPYYESCDSSAVVTAPSGAFSCQPAPPTYPSNPVRLNITEGSAVATPAGFVDGRVANPRHVVIYTLFPQGNDETLYDRLLNPVGRVPDVFAIGACSGEILLNRANVISYDNSLRMIGPTPATKRFFNLIVQGCTQGNVLACANVTVQIEILNAPTRPRFPIPDPDPSGRADGVYVRSHPECTCSSACVVGRSVFSSTGLPNGLAIAAVSEESNPITYSMAPGGDAGGLFQVNRTTGHLQLARSSGLNFESVLEYLVIVRATDAVNGLTEDQEVSVLVTNAPDCPAFPPSTNPPQPFTQFIEVPEATVTTLSALIGTLAVTDEDAGATMTASITSANPPAWLRIIGGTTVQVAVSTTVARAPYGSITQNPLQVWRGRLVREVVRLTVQVRDNTLPTALTATANVEIGVLSSASDGGLLPQMTGITIPNAMGAGTPGLLTRGGETITISGRNFNQITNAYGGVLAVSFNSQVDDPFPNRTYVCTSPRVVNDNTITCTSPHGWGSNLFVQVTFDVTRKVMAAESGVLVVSYAPPVLIQGQFSMGSRYSFTSDMGLCERESMPTTGGCMLLLSASNLGVQADASRMLRVEFGLPVPGTDRLEYVAPYVPCGGTRTYETWATPANPNGIGAGQTRVCIMVPPGIGGRLTFQVRVGTVVSNVSAPNPWELPPATMSFFGWFLSYTSPVIDRVWKAIDLAGTAPPVWDRNQNAGFFAPGETVWFNGTNFGPMDKMPQITFWLPSNLRVMYDNGRMFQGVFNFTPPVNPATGMPNCWKPRAAEAHRLMACEVPYGASMVVRLRMQLGSLFHAATGLNPSISFILPNITSITGPGTRNANTEGGQEIIVRGVWLGALEQRFAEITSNTYVPKPYPVNPNTLNYLPITLWYGPTPQAFLSSRCRVTSEQPSEITCLSGPGVGRNFQYMLSVGGQTSTLIVNTAGYAPPLISSVERRPGEPVDGQLGRVPTVREYRTNGGDVFRINGRNFGPCPVAGCTFLERQANPAFVVEYYVQLDDPRTDYGTNIGDAARRVLYRAHSCNMTIPHQQVECRTVIGAGTDAVVRMTVAGQPSILPFTAYGRPAVTTLSILSPAGVPKAAASTDGGDTLIIRGINFGPRTNGSVACSPTARCRGMIQTITYGVGGEEYRVTDWDIPASAESAHDEIRVVLGPGVGASLRVVVTVADQESLTSPATFSYASPVITTWGPRTGPAVPSTTSPVSITLSGNNFGLANRFADVFVAFGNPEDGSLIQGISPTSRFPDVSVPTTVRSYLASPEPRTETITFNLPAGAGRQRAVRLFAIDRTSASAVPVFSAPVLFDYTEPSIDAVVVEALKQYANASGTGDITPEFGEASRAFPETINQVRKLTIRGQNFGTRDVGNVAWQVELADFDTPVGTNATWSPAPSTQHLIFEWSDERIVVLTTVSRSLLRVRRTGLMFNPPINPVSGLRDPVPLDSISNVYQFADISPEIGNLVGGSGPFRTTGGQIISFTVTGLASTSTDLTVTVTSNGVSRVCPIVYAPDDARGAGQPVGTAADVRTNIIFNNVGRRYWTNPDGSTASFSVSSAWTLFCRLPPGQGSAASLVISRDGVPSEAFPISYLRPAISQIELLSGGVVQQTIAFVPGVVVSVPTPGMEVRVSGSNFGTCPGVIAGVNMVFMQLPDCNSTQTLQQAGSSATNLLDSAASSSVLSFVMPEGEGTGYTFAVQAGDQSSLTDQFVSFTYRVPTITSVTREARTVGGDVFTLEGTNLGITAPSITLGSYICLDVVRAVGLAGHSSVSCTVPEGSGAALDVAVTVAAQRAVLSGGFSYSRPVVHMVEITNATGATLVFNTSTLASDFLSGPAEGGYRVKLYGDNFGVPDYSRHCLFVSWRARAGRTRQPPNTPFNCADRRETFIGEGQLPELALTAFGDVVAGSGNETVQNMAWSHNEITFLFPPGTGFKDIVVFVAGNTPVRPPVWRYDPPTITNELEPSSGPTDGGTDLRIAGMNFGTPALRTDTPAGVLSAQNLPVPESLEAYLNRQFAPQAAMSITFGRGCVSEHFAADGSTPAFLSRCERGRIRTHGVRNVRFTSPAGVGLNRSVFVSIWDLVPVPGNEDELIETEIRSNAVIFNYEPPEAELTEPRPLLLDDEEGGVVFIRGRNFGTLKLARLQQWTPEEEFVNVTINNRVAALRVERVVEAGSSGQDIDKVRVLLPNLPVGYHNMTYTVAGQTGITTTSPLTRAALLVGCQAGIREDFRTEDMGPWGGYFGRPGETCAACPVGAICLGFDSRFGPRTSLDRGSHMYPIPVIGFYNLNSSDSLTTGMYDACPEEVRARYLGRDTCVVRCDPPEACLGANQCAPEYVSKAPMYRCASCAPGFYKRATVCVKCPDSPWALVIGFTMLVMVGGGVAYALNRVRINIAYIAIAIDYFQVLAIFAQSRVQWPAALQELFHVLSAFNLNIEIVAPECIVPDLGFQRKWSFVMAFPLALQVFFALVTLVNLGYKAIVKGQKVKLAYLGGAIMASVLMVMYVMYIYLTRNILDIYNCRPTDPPDGKRYMVAVFEECGKPGGVQLTLLPAAIVATIVYIIGYPAGVGYLLYKERELVMEDQLLRAKGMGDDRASNPHAYQFRKRWGRLYYQFKPDACLWILVIILRKFLIAATFVLFNTQPAFQLAAVFLVLFLAYSAQMRFDPYMSPQDFENVLEDHRKKAFTDITHQRLKASLDGISTRTKRTTRKNLLDAQGKVDAQALLGILRGWLFNYNTVEQLMLFSAGIVCVMGMMFAAQQRRSSTYRESRDAITSVVIAVVALSIIYLFTVFVVEVTVLAGEANRKKLAQSGVKKSEDDAVKKTAKKDASAPEKEFEAGNVQSATNPMFLGKQQSGSSRMASASSADDDGIQTNLDALEAADAISSMRDPPGNKEMWQLYKEKYLELAGTVATLREQLDNTPATLRAPGSGASVAAN